MRSAEVEARRGLARLGRALDKVGREIRGLAERLDASEAEGFPGDDCAEMERHVEALRELVGRERARQRAKILREGVRTGSDVARPARSKS